MEKCKRCAARTVLSDGDIQKMIDEITSMRGIKLVDDEMYKTRFSVCESCDSFLYGSTCGVCGCVMQARARLQDGKCPKKKW